MNIHRPLWRLHLHPGPCVRRANTVFLQNNFSTITPSLKKAPALPPRPTLPDNELKHTYLKGSGPGGQKINKTNSAAQLTHLPTGLVVKCQATRSRSQNHSIAKRILAEKVEMLEKGQDSRAAKVVERKQRRKRSADKKKRRKYRQLADEGQGEGRGVGEEEEGDEDEDDDDGEEQIDRVDHEGRIAEESSQPPTSSTSTSKG